MQASSQTTVRKINSGATKSISPRSLCLSELSVGDFLLCTRSLLAAAIQNAIRTEDGQSWLARAQLLVGKDTAAVCEDLGPDWDIPENLSLMVKYWAARFATRECLSTCLRRDLNRLANSRPLLFERYGCHYTFDVRHAREELWDHHFTHMKGLPNVKVLDIGSFEGLAAVWLAENVLTHGDSELISVDTTPLDCCCGLLLRRNLASIVAQSRVTFLRGPLLAQIQALKAKRFHIITIGPFIPALQLVWLVPILRRLLVPGGVLSFDYLVNHPVYSLLSTTSVPPAALSDEVLCGAPGYTVLRSGYHAMITAQV